MLNVLCFLKRPDVRSKSSCYYSILSFSHRCLLPVLFPLPEAAIFSWNLVIRGRFFPVLILFLRLYHFSEGGGEKRESSFLAATSIRLMLLFQRNWLQVAKLPTGEIMLRILFLTFRLPPDFLYPREAALSFIVPPFRQGVFLQRSLGFLLAPTSCGDKFLQVLNLPPPPRMFRS